MTYLSLKNTHVAAAIITFTGVVLRGYWMITASDGLQHRLTRTAPHVVDTVLFLSGIAMLLPAAINPFLHRWLPVRLTGLIGCVLPGTLAIRRGGTRRIRIVAFIAALALFVCISGVASNKSATSWLAYLA